jgi:hypothetical protein
MYYYLTAGILADKPLQTAIVSCYIFFKTKISLEIISIQYISFFSISQVCQQSGVWKEGNFYCALRTTYYPPVSISFSSSTEIPR